MEVLQYHYHNTIERDFVLTENIKSPFSIPKFKKVIISTGGGDSDEHYILSSLLILDYITAQKPVITCRKDNKFGLIVGGKVTLRKSRMFLFIAKLLFEVLPSLKSFEGFKYPNHKNAFLFTVNDIFLFGDLAIMLPVLDSSTCCIKIQMLTTSVNTQQLFKLGRSSLICFL